MFYTLIKKIIVIETQTWTDALVLFSVTVKDNPWWRTYKRSVQLMKYISQKPFLWLLPAYAIKQSLKCLLLPVRLTRQIEFVL